MLNSHSENSNLNSTHSNVRGYTKFVKYEGDESALTSMLQKNYKPDSHVFMLGRKPEIPTPFFTQGNFLPKRYGKLPKNLISQPLYEIDNYYTNTFIVISKNRTIYRFNKQKSFYLFSPHSIIRNKSLCILTSPYFNFFVIAVILSNCTLMAINNESIYIEYGFTLVYTIEFLLKVVCRGFVLHTFSYLRDPWNILDFVVIFLAYVTLIFPIGNVTVIRMFRVFRVLKTVSVVPGLKTIVRALIEACYGLKDVLILTVFMLSIFSLLGLQLYQGKLGQQCIKNFDNSTFVPDIPTFAPVSVELFCKHINSSSDCPVNYTCQQTDLYPNYSYTNYDNFGAAMLCSFRLITQDFWQDLYQKILRTNGYWHLFFFILIIFLGSFYLINLILAIVSLAYESEIKKSKCDELPEQIDAAGINPDRKRKTRKISKVTLNELVNIDDIPYIDENKSINEDDRIKKIKIKRTWQEIVKQTQEDRNKKKNILSRKRLAARRRNAVQFKTNEKSILFSRFFERHIENLSYKVNKNFPTLFFLIQSVEYYVTNPIFDVFMTFVIIANTIIMSLDRYEINEYDEYILNIGNMICTFLFALEAITKLIALNPINYFKNSWNCFDMFIVCLSLIELGLSTISGLSILRSLRLLRIFKLAKSWQTLNLLISIIGKALGALRNLTIILAIIIFIFAVMGMQLFGNIEKPSFYGDSVPSSDITIINNRSKSLIPYGSPNYNENKNWHFNDFLHSFMIVFRILCGEWIELMWECMIDNGYYCIPYFLITLVIENLVLLNLFLALLIHSFDSNNSISKPPNSTEKSKNTSLIFYIKRFLCFIKRKINILLKKCFCKKRIRTESLTFQVRKTNSEENDCHNEPNLSTILEGNNETVKIDEKKKVKSRWKSIGVCYAKLQLVVKSKQMDYFIMMIVLMSSILLIVEDNQLSKKPVIMKVVYYLDITFTVIFIIEMILKMICFGVTFYFTNAWCLLDFFIVFISILSLLGDLIGISNVNAFRALRTLRAFRPLRAISRWESMRVVVNALIQAIPSIFHVLIVCLLFWLVFGIMGVHLFAGKFQKCVYDNGTIISVDIIKNKTQCNLYNYTWKNERINFDHILSAYLALFHVATFKGWIQIMRNAVDSTTIDQQPYRDASTHNYAYFIIFIIFGSFFTLNLFIGVIIDNFNMQKKKVGETVDLLMTEKQKRLYLAMKKYQTKQPRSAIKPPKNAILKFCFNVVTSQKFDIFIMIIILLNMISMSLEHYNQSKYFTQVLSITNQIFIGIFTFECCFKLLALRQFYFKEPWNTFDFIIVTLSIIGLIISDIFESITVSPTLLRVTRVFRISRVLRLVKSAKGIRTLLFSLAVSIPALFNIGLLLFLCIYIYAVFGMSLFMHVKHTAGINNCTNFETFINSVILLFQISTSAGWDTILEGITNDTNCEPASETNEFNNCGSNIIGTAYIVSYIVVIFLVVVNMYIAVIIENFSQASEDVKRGLTQDDFDLFYEEWELYDPKATKYIDLDQLSDLIDSIQPPLRIPKPNEFVIIQLDIPICKNNRVYCVDILNALTKNFLGYIDGTEVNDIELKINKSIHYHRISSTLHRQREKLCAKIIQNAFYNFCNRRKSITEENKSL